MVAQAPEPIFSTGLVAAFAARHAVVDLVATAVQHIGRTAILAAPVAPCDDCIGGSEAPAAVSGQILVDHQCRFEVVSGMARGQGFDAGERKPATTATHAALLLAQPVSCSRGVLAHDSEGHVFWPPPVHFPPPPPFGI